MAGSALTLQALTRSETARRGYGYAAASLTMVAAVLAIGLVV